MKKPGLAKIKAEAGKIVITPVRSDIFKFAGKYQKLAKKKKTKVENIRDLIDYSNL